MITEIINFTNGKLTSPTAPEYKCSIFGGYLYGINYDKIINIILEKEKEITSLDLPPEMVNDGYTGLDSRSMTARYKNFNVLMWDDPEILKLKQEIRDFYDLSTEYFQIDKTEKVFIQCWSNVLRKGQKMDSHRHCNDSDESFLSGHITIKCDNTQTIYQNPYSNVLHSPEYYYFNNVPGRINIFQSHIYHYTTEHRSDSERITIAFDLFWKHKPDSGVFIEL